MDFFEKIDELLERGAPVFTLSEGEKVPELRKADGTGLGKVLDGVFYPDAPIFLADFSGGVIRETVLPVTLPE